jgi:Asp-tRNA(Asn)/Glu-tRNA(Gln) amidotransferase B subunit
MREKDGLDYRFLPEPNLPRLRIEEEWIRSAKESTRSVLPYMEYVARFNADFAMRLSHDEELERFLKPCLPLLALSTEEMVEWLRQLEMICKKSDAHYPPQSEQFSRHFADVVNFESQGKITRLIAIDLIKGILKDANNGDIAEIIERNRLWRVSDAKAVDETIDDILAKEPQLRAKAATGSGTTKHFNKLRNAAIAKSRKCISVDDIERALKRKLNIL